MTDLKNIRVSIGVFVNKDIYVKQFLKQESKDSFLIQEKNISLSLENQGTMVFVYAEAEKTTLNDLLAVQRSVTTITNDLITGRYA